MGKTVYVLLSGERRYRAMEYLEKRGDATWNTIKNCNVITTSLSENVKKGAFIQCEPAGPRRLCR